MTPAEAAEQHVATCCAFTDACRLVTAECYGPDVLWLYDEYDRIKREFFSGELPPAFITIGLTAHGRCLGLTRSSTDRAPVIRIHPSIFGGTEKTNPWHVPAEWLGRSYAGDVLLHEAMHVSVHYLLGGANGPTSHNNPQWVAEVNRLAPLLGFPAVQAGRSKVRRRQGKAMRIVEGDVPFLAVATFPTGYRHHFGTATHHYVLHGESR